MSTEEIVSHINSVLKLHKDDATPLENRIFWIQAKQLLFDVVGEDNEFYKSITSEEDKFKKDGHTKEGWIAHYASTSLRALKNYIEAGRYKERSIKIQIQQEIVSDFLEQATTLLESKTIHPAAPAIIIGAALEEFLRTWVENQQFTVEGKPSIDTYAKALKEKNLIQKQDMKDITSWAGLRNEATHGNFDEVNDVNRIKLMLEGVNLFIRKYS